MNFEELLKSTNTRLKNQNLKIKIAKRGNTLYLRGYFPSKSNKTKLERQDVSLGITASLIGLQLAESEAIRIGAAIQSETFSWEPYSRKESKKVEVKTAGNWIREFEQDYFESRAKNGQSELTWKKDYLAVFNKLNLVASLSTRDKYGNATYRLKLAAWERLEQQVDLMYCPF